MSFHSRVSRFYIPIELNKEKQKLIRLIAVKSDKNFSKCKKENYRPHVTLCTNNDLSIAHKIADKEFSPFNRNN